MTIWKYPLVHDGTNRIRLAMPLGARVLALQMQHLIPCLWALVDDSAEKETRAFVIVGTGWPDAPANPDLYVGTYQDGGFVWHVFETREATR